MQPQLMAEVKSRTPLRRPSGSSEKVPRGAFDMCLFQCRDELGSLDPFQSSPCQTPHCSEVCGFA